jgi:hypothetical protein
VRADAAVAVTVERCRVATGSAITLTGDEIDERRFLGLLQIVPLSVPGQDGARRAVRLGDRPRSRVHGNFAKYRPSIPNGQEGEAEVSAFDPIVPTSFGSACGAVVAPFRGSLQAVVTTSGLTRNTTSARRARGRSHRPG